MRKPRAHNHADNRKNSCEKARVEERKYKLIATKIIICSSLQHFVFRWTGSTAKGWKHSLISFSSLSVCTSLKMTTIAERMSTATVFVTIRMFSLAATISGAMNPKIRSQQECLLASESSLRPDHAASTQRIYVYGHRDT